MYPFFVVLAGTGMRISEISGLRWKDIDFEEGEIHINHALVYENATGRLAIHMPKTDAGYRRIPMVKEVREALLEEKRNQIFRGHRNCCEVDGYSDFVFVSREKTPRNQRQISLYMMMPFLI